jgi:hypothetical protein
MLNQIYGGRAAITVGSAAQVPLLSTEATGVGMHNVKAITINVSAASAGITVRFFNFSGDNVDGTELTELEQDIASGGTVSVSIGDMPMQRLLVTGQTSSGDATVNCDWTAQQYR